MEVRATYAKGGGAMSRTDAIFTAANKGDRLKALELCFQNAGEDVEERRFCCALAVQLEVSFDDEELKPSLRDSLLICPLVWE